jgi:ferritin
MISERLTKLLVEQIGHELRAHQTYLGISLYFDRQSLSRWGKLFRDQSIEEAGHATRIMTFLTDNGVQFDLPALRAATTRYPGPAQAVQKALDGERDMSTRFQVLTKAALDEEDHTSHQFLMWFVNEQVEEERKIQGLVDLVASGINLFQAEPLLDKFE